VRPNGIVLLAAGIGLATGSFVAAQTLTVAAEGTTSSTSPTQVSGPLPVLTVSNAGACNGQDEATCRSFVAFDLSPLSAAPMVEKAVLRLWVVGVVTPGTIDVAPVLEAWREDTVTADSSPPLGSPVVSFDVASGGAGNFIDVDVTALVRDWASGAMANHGLALASSGPANVLFGTRSTQAPELEIAGGDTTPIGNGRVDAGISAGTWVATTVNGAPVPRYDHTAVWTGSRMIVWGGFGDSGRLGTGGRYDPVTDSWTPTTTFNAPAARNNHTAVWTGSRMVVWGGWVSNVGWNTGGQYDPVIDSWTPTTTVGAPSGRYDHTAVWTGSRMIVWGGTDGWDEELKTGAVYDPATNSWAPVPTTGAPDARSGHTAVWTGSRMIVWGGTGCDELCNSGGLYDPATGSWMPTSTVAAPVARWAHTAVWTGSRMIVWGGSDGSGRVIRTGGVYDPATDSWTATTTSWAPTPRAMHTAVWINGRMTVWGGEYWDDPYDPDLEVFYNDGYEYDPVANVWQQLPGTGAPSVRAYHTAVSYVTGYPFTYKHMIVWGGFLEPDSSLGSGGHYSAQTYKR
jgi:N-acetylneuraminic acid mutarotase